MVGSQVRFDRSDRVEREFHTVLKQRIDAYFDERGISRHANATMVLKTVFWCGGSLVTWLVLMSGVVAMPLTLGLWALLGFQLACVGLNVGHDAIHGAYSRNRRLNWDGWSMMMHSTMMNNGSDTIG